MRPFRSLARIVQKGRRRDPDTESITVTRFEWDSGLETGHAEIDDQHRGLFALAKKLDALLSCEECQFDAVADAIYGLNDYVIEHFREEEALMASVGYPELNSHRALHERLTGETMKLMARYFGGETMVAADIAPFVGEWLTIHIDKQDKRFATFARKTPRDSMRARGERVS